jgi:hypothetical protein
VVEEWKWGIPVWSHDGLRLHRRDLQEGREDHLRQGRVGRRSQGPVQLQPRRKHPPRHRFPEGATIDEDAFKALIRAAVALNVSTGKTKKRV